MTVRLGHCTFDDARSRFDGPEGPIRLRRKSFEVLRHLVHHAEEVVSKEQLVQAVWRDAIVGDDSLAQCITEIRRALGPEGRDIIKTIPRRGYLLSAAFDDRVTTGPEGEGSTPLPRRPSIAVLPFCNLGVGMGGDYLSDGIAEDIITELSRFSELFVVARNSSFQFGANAHDPRSVARRLGVRYLLEGSIRREGRRARINAKLIDAASGLSIWAERYDRVFEDALTLQDEVARNIVGVLPVHVSKAERERVLSKPPTAWEAYDFCLRGLDCVAAYHASYDKELLFKARRSFEAATQFDPYYARAFAAISSCYVSQWIHRWDDDCKWSEALDRSYQFARESVQLAPELPDAHIALGQSLIFHHQHDAAVGAIERARALNPNLTSFRFAYVYVLSGQAELAVKLLRSHIRLDPFYEPNAPAALGFSYCMLGQYEEAVPLLLEALSRAPAMAHGRYILAMAFAQLGRMANAQAQVEIALRLEPWYRISQSLTARYFKRSADRDHLISALRKAGFPD